MFAIFLHNADLHAEILPGIGGGLSRLDWIRAGRRDPVLRGFDAAPGAPPPMPSQLACFPLVPWSNRIGGAGFEFEGRSIRLAPNRAGEPYPVHGEGWQQAWDIKQQSDTELHLQLDRQDGAAFSSPFSYLAELRYVLQGAQLQVSLAVRNTGSLAMPFGLGLHPWMSRSSGVQLRAAARTVWQRGEGGLPTAEAALPADWDFAALRALPADAIDNVFTGWDGEAEILWPETGIRLRIQADMAYYILYTPPGKDFFCFEPVDHLINAHNLPGGAAHNGLTILAPGQQLQRHVSFGVAAEAQCGA